MTPTSARPNRRRMAGAPLLVVVAAVVTAGCGSVGYNEGTGDRARGKELFTQKCASCHTLADAGTTSTIGPNLDDAFAESRRNGLGESTFVQVVRDQIAYAITETSTGAPGMPADLVTGQDANDVASYVASVAGTGERAAPKPKPEPPAKGGGAAGDVAAGKIVFVTTASCGGCHTLADAGSSGSIGPNLDVAKPSAALVKMRVTNGKGVMPPFKDKLDATQIADVVAYVSSVAGK